MSAKPHIFIAYSRKDLLLLERLRIHLNVLSRKGLCHIFYDGVIAPGDRWDDRIKKELHHAQIFLLLISEDFLDSDYINEVELPKILERQRDGSARVVPVILRDCLWQYTELRDLQAVLKDGRPIEENNGFAHAASAVAGIITEFNQAAREEAAARERRQQAEKERLEKEEERRRLHSLDPFHDLMVRIPGGPFEMGDIFREGRKDELPLHSVTIRDFYLCQYPVTQGQWKRIMGDNPSYFKGDDNLPVEQVPWHDAQTFIRKLNEKYNQNYRLPSEAEWEYAAREGGRTVRFGNGKDIADPGEINFNGSADNKKAYSITGAYLGKTTPVRSYPPNSLGLYDMSGNVWEWCEDVWHDNYKGAPEDGSAWTQGGDQARRILRGGSWYNGPESCRAAFRYRGDAASRLFRFSVGPVLTL